MELKRSRFPDDPDGQVILNVLRNGISREVNVTWRLEIIGQTKFHPPYYGDVTFKIVSFKLVTDFILSYLNFLVVYFYN